MGPACLASTKIIKLALFEPFCAKNIKMYPLFYQRFFNQVCTQTDEGSGLVNNFID
jgi:hypothetical protein